MQLSTKQWHERYQQQTHWTKDIRRYLYDLSGLSTAKRVLDVGCGTGALLEELDKNAGETTLGFDGDLYGIDISANNISYANSSGVVTNLILGDALSLPFAEGSFDITLCHFFLLWITHPEIALAEMVRVTRPSGAILAIAEPDYGGRIDYPLELNKLGKWQVESLRKSGADPYIGRRLREIFIQAGLVDIHTGVLGGQWSSNISHKEIQSEWDVLRFDLEALFADDPDTGWQAEFERLRALDELAWIRGERVLYVPTFYALGHVPKRRRVPE
ncbi:MAG TPA: hypothetical protein DEH25_14790 [Chloroflexi bacterium]|nr:hypothetical protein [Chloroflexota bacterium]